MELKFSSFFCFKTVGDLIKYLETKPEDMEICGIGGGEVTVTIQNDEPDTLWFE